MIRSFALPSAVVIALIGVAEAAAGGLSESLRVPTAMLDRVEKDLAAARPVIESVSLKALPSLTFASGKHIDTSRRTSLQYYNRFLPELVKLLRHERSLGGVIMLVNIVGTIDESLGDMSLELKEYSDSVYERHEARTRSQPASTDSVAEDLTEALTASQWSLDLLKVREPFLKLRADLSQKAFEIARAADGALDECDK